MNKNKIILIIFSSLCSNLQASRTFFSLPVPFHPASAERLTMLHYQMRDYTNEPNNNLWITCFGGQSTSPERLAAYFFPFNKTCLITGGFGSQAVKNHDVDLLVHYFDVLTGDDYRNRGEHEDIFDIIPSWTYESHLSICPVHSFWGIGFVYHRQLSCNHNKGFWFELALPIMGIKNNMNLRETIIEPTTCDDQQNTSFFSPDGQEYAYKSMTCALRSSNFQYGRIDAREYCKAKWGVADLEGHLGYTYCRTSNYHLSNYIGILVPTGNVPHATYLFEKVIGYNGHTGFFLGLRGGIAIWQHNTNKLSVELETSQTIFLEKIQLRSFDLQGKPWGRYIWVYPSSDTKTFLSPGINYFTKAVSISHGSLRNLNIAGTYNTQRFQAELGYHCYMRGDEEIRLAKKWLEEPALAALWYSDNTFIGSQDRRVSRSGATINEYLNIHNDVKEFSSSTSKENDVYVPVRACQLDLESATHPAIVMHSIYGSLGYGWYESKIPTLINIACSYNFGYGTAVMNHWKLWFKVGASF